jgi:hypothetical protein
MAKVDSTPEDAWRLRLAHRCAFVMGAHSPGSDDMVFNAPLYHAILTMVWDVLQSDRAEILGFDEPARRVSSATELEAVVGEQSRVHDEPAPGLTMFRGEAAVAFIESQPWARVGGPEVYHDTYTVAVHTATDVSEILVAHAHELSTRCETELAEVLRMSPDPVRRSRSGWLRRRLKWN